MSQTNFSVIPEGKAWPGGDYHELALLAVSEPQVEAAVSSTLLHGVEQGLGPWAAVGLELSCGALVELIKYQQSPSPGFVVRASVGIDPAIVLGEVLALLGLTNASVAWASAVVGG